jgi:CheY-like chemotaxis protein
MAQRATVVCIEDEVEIIELIKQILGRRRIDVVGAFGGREGLKQIAAVRPDLVLLDLIMPEMGGWEVFQTMRATAAMRDIPVIVVTARAEPIDRLLGLHVAGVNDYIAKPFKPEALVQSVENILASRHN